MKTKTSKKTTTREMERQAFARWQKRKGIRVLGFRELERAEYLGRLEERRQK